MRFSRTQNLQLARRIRDAACPLRGASRDYDRLLEQVGNARFVLLGEASHGTHEFYNERARITRRLIEEKGFNAVALEADWPDAYRVNRFVRGVGSDERAFDAVSDFRRFPMWMWRNADVIDFVDWLRSHNDAIARPDRKVGLYGLDLYSLHASIQAVVGYLDRIDPEAARRARRRYACFDHFGEDAQAYGFAAGYGLKPSCEDEVVGQLVDMRRRAPEYSLRDGRIAEEEYFSAEQNARVAKDAEQYYRAMFHGRVNTWNLRDRHMADTLEALAHHLDRLEGPSRIVVWAHNSHLGDARATEMGERGEWNLGQLVREAHPNEAVLAGFTTHSGTVTAASDWDAPVERKRVRPGLPNSYESLFHEVGLPRFLLPLGADSPVAEALREPRLERAIGVIYRPETERVSHYFHSRLSDQFDAVLHFDQTEALEPLDRTTGWDVGEVPETYPAGV